MRITPETLHKLARDTVNQRVRSDHDLIAVYLHGSMLGDNPLLGGAADVDLFFVHHENPLLSREIVPLTDDVHLDISHVARNEYRQARELRRHPWIGPTLYGCKILYDPQHFMDFTQASVRGQFNDPSNVLARAHNQAERARQIWFSLHSSDDNPSMDSGLSSASDFLIAVSQAANSIASLSGAPLPERRFLLDFPTRAGAVDRPGLHQGLIGLLGGSSLDPAIIQDWLSSWKAAYTAIPEEKRPAGLHTCRQTYYEKAFQAFLSSPQPMTILWPLLNTWTQAVKQLQTGASPISQWEEAAQTIGLIGAGFTERVAALDAYLDTVEETLDIWANNNGAS